MPLRPWSDPHHARRETPPHDRLRLPPVAVSTAVGLALVVSTVPSLLPRTPVVQGVLSAALVLLALSLVGVGRRVRRAAGRPGTPVPAARRAAVVVAGVAVLVAVTVAHLRLTDRTEALSIPAPSWTYWPVVGVSAVALTALVTALGTGALHTLRAVRRAGRSRVAALLLVTTVTTTAASAGGLLDPMRKDLATDHPMLSTSPTGAVRAFASLEESPDPEAGAALAVDRLVAAGGLERAAVVVVLPTGSGWVNGAAVEAVEADLRGDVAVVSAQYSDLPSWYQYLLDQDAALRSGTALLTDVLDRVDDLPPGDRPDVYVYGESLGAFVGQAAVRQVPHDEVCGVLWSGAPGADLTGHPHERSLLNADDPIRYLETDTAYHRPEGWPTVWLPLLSYATTWLDTSVSLRPAHGHGHQYGVEQDWSLPRC